MMRSHRARRCAVVGLAATTLVLIGSSVLGTVSTRRSAETVARSAALAEAYDRAHDAVTSRPDPGAGRRACPAAGGQAKTALAVCWLNALSASLSASRRWTGTNCCRGSRWKQMKTSPASRRPFGSAPAS